MPDSSSSAKDVSSVRDDKTGGSLEKISSLEPAAVLLDNVSLDSEHRNPGGAPIEDDSPLGKEVGWWSAVFLSAYYAFLLLPAATEIKFLW